MPIGGQTAGTDLAAPTFPPHKACRCACPLEVSTRLRGSEFLKKPPLPALSPLLAWMGGRMTSTKPIAETFPPHKARRFACTLEFSACLQGSEFLNIPHYPALSPLLAWMGGRTAGTKPSAATSPPHKARRCACPLEVSARLQVSELLMRPPLPSLSPLLAQTGGRTSVTTPIIAKCTPHKARRCACPLEVSNHPQGLEFLKRPPSPAIRPLLCHHVASPPRTHLDHSIHGFRL